MNAAADSDDRVTRFLASGPFAVVGASRHRAKYGNKVLRAYLQRGMPVFAVNPNCSEVEGMHAYPDLASLPEPVASISIITPPPVTERIIHEAAAAGVRHLWMQPGAESPVAIERARRYGLEVIADGTCFLVVSGFREARGGGG